MWRNDWGEEKDGLGIDVGGGASSTMWEVSSSIFHQHVSSSNPKKLLNVG